MIRFLLSALFGSGLLLYGQPSQPYALDFNGNTWLAYSGDHPIAGPWGLHFDAQWRRAEVVLTPQQYQVRGGVNFDASRNVQVTAGYLYGRSYPYGDFPARAASPEHRIYEQAVLKSRFRNLRISNRVRLEQRWAGSPDGGERSWTYRNRFRYRLKADFPLTEENGSPLWYVPASEEILVALPPNGGARAFDQNRLFIGLGRTLGKAGKLEVGYMNQFVGQRNGRVFEFNSNLIVELSSTLPLAKLFGR